MATDAERAAHLAANRVEAMLLEMLRRGEFGEVAVVITPTGLQPVKRRTEEERTIRIAQGHSLITAR